MKAPGARRSPYYSTSVCVLPLPGSLIPEMFVTDDPVFLRISCGWYKVCVLLDNFGNLSLNTQLHTTVTHLPQEVAHHSTCIPHHRNSGTATAAASAPLPASNHRAEHERWADS
jgi:ABC-type microcin C transport system permease subunit YejE